MCACPWFSFRKLGILSPFPQATARRKTFRALRSCSVFSVLGCVCLGIVITDACCIGYRGCVTIEWQMIITIVVSIFTQMHIAIHPQFYSCTHRKMVCGTCVTRCLRTHPQRHFSTDEYVYYKSQRMVQLDDELGDISCKISDREFSILDEVRPCCASRCEVISIDHVLTGSGEAAALYRGRHSDVPRDGSFRLRPFICQGRHRSQLGRAFDCQRARAVHRRRPPPVV